MKNVKEFIRKHNKEILFIGGLAFGIAGTYLVCKSKMGKTITLKDVPEWAVKWRDHCDVENLLYENGLPIFANLDQTQIYRDALSSKANVAELIEQGFEIVERA